MVKGTSCQATEPRSWEIRPTVGALLDRLDPSPAVVVSRVGDLVAANSSYRRWPGRSGCWTPTNPTSPASFSPTREQKPRTPTGIRSLTSGRPTCERRQLWVTRMPPSSARSWRSLSARHSAAGTTTLPACPNVSASKRWTHPLAGELVLAYESLELPHSDEQRLVAYLAADDATSVALESLSRTALTN
nr:hypothetical protein [Fodinicola feengrottensis]